ncbi:MAG: 5-oxoprolinase subunit PxpB [Treponema sp.]|nr:5-oxoprolinase subunit PxpB [Treponema sp.]
MKDVSILLSSEDSLQVRFPQKICGEVNASIRAFVENLKSYTSDIPQILEILPTYCAVTVYFDPDEIKASVLEKILEEVIEKTEDADFTGEGEGRLLEIPVCYEDEEFGPDLSFVAEHSGLSKEEVISLHHSRDYLIYMLGFLPGFPYLGGMDERLECPRLESPRTKIPAGSIAIGGSQTGLYPSDSPGGWRIIGRTPLKVFDQNREEACLYHAGDRIRFVPISRKEFDRISAEEKGEENSAERKSPVKRYACTSGIKILEGGMLTTVQDKGRFAFQHEGIGQSGVMDFESFALANSILGNEENAACLEVTLSGPEILFNLPCEFVITGGLIQASLDGREVSMNKKYQAGAGSILKCGFVTKGLRSYIAFKGGLLVPDFFGSSSTNLKSRTGGCFGRKLEKGDEIPIGDHFLKASLEERKALSPVNLDLLSGDKPLILLCTKGSQYSDFSKEVVENFQKNIFTILPQSDRMGIRFSGEGIKCGQTDIISDAIPFGAVQITSSGLPLVMGADRQTTGGYAKIASVKKHFMCLLAQAQPGTKVQFLIEES